MSKFHRLSPCHWFIACRKWLQWHGQNSKPQVISVGMKIGIDWISLFSMPYSASYAAFRSNIFDCFEFERSSATRNIFIASMKIECTIFMWILVHRLFWLRRIEIKITRNLFALIRPLLPTEIEQKKSAGINHFGLDSTGRQNIRENKRIESVKENSSFFFSINGVLVERIFKCE